MKKIIFVIVIVIISLKIYSKNQLEEGYNTFYYENGIKSSEGFIKNGKPDGFWKSYYVNGILKSEGNRVNGILDSLWVFYDEFGDTLSKINYVNGNRNGHSVYFNKNDLGNIYIEKKELYLKDLLEGIAEEYFYNGNKKKVIAYKNGKKDGKEYILNSNGNVITEHNYIKGRLIEILNVNRTDDKGRKDGLWREYYSNFRIKKEFIYSNGLLNGYYKEFDENGNLKRVLSYSNGKLLKENESTENIRVKEEFFDNGFVKYRGSFLKGNPIGIHNFFKSDGSIVKSEEYDDSGNLIGEGKVDKEGFKQGKWTGYFIDGNIKYLGQYLNNGKNGKWEYFYKSGNREQIGNFNNGKYQGNWIWYYENGNIKREENYFNGKNDGDYIEYDENENIIVQGSFIEGEKDGKWFYDIGDIIIKGGYSLGLKDGKWEYFFKNGNLRFSGNYIQGNADGKHFLYYSNGNIEEERFYNTGVKDKTWKKYDENGTLKITITYRNDVELKINGVKVDGIKQENKIL